jgi:hypothetical protein
MISQLNKYLKAIKGINIIMSVYKLSMLETKI